MRGLQPILAILFMLMVSIAQAQQEPAPEENQTPDMPMMQQDAQQQMPMDAAKMEHMADAMASMARACETMMMREMAAYPFKVAAGAVLGLIGTVALVLLVVLEIQWIRLLGLRIKQANGE